MLQVTLFGHVHLAYNGKRLTFAVRPKVAPLLAYLLLNRGPLARDSVAFALWPDESEAVARANLRRHLLYLREALPRSRTPWVLADQKNVGWNPAAPVHADVIEFQRSAENLDELEIAVAVYGELLQGCDDDWLIDVRERLRRSYVQALFELVRRARGRRDRAAASDYLERILADDPWREDAVRSLMTVRWEGGDRASALQLCAEFAGRLRREMAAALMPETIALRDAIERGNPLPAVPAVAVRETAGVSSADLPFEGRETELARLQELWQRAIAGAGEFAIVLGEAGIGKTRLAAEFALSVEANGARVFWGSTAAPETAPYQAIIEATRAVLSFTDLSRLSAYDLAILARLIPELQEESSADDAGGEPNAERLFDLVGALFGEVSRQRPALFVFEDLHGASRATVAMLERIAQRCRQAAILILITLREDEPLSIETIGRLRRPRRGEPPSVVPLGPLSELAAQSIVAKSLRASAGATALAVRSAGHPLFLAELIQAAADGGGDAIGSLPAHFREIIEARSRRLSPAANLMLRAASVVGGSFDLEVVGETVGWSESRLSAAADELVARRVIRQTPSGRSFEYEFAHDLIASAAYESVPERDRRRWHRRAGRAAERWYAARLHDFHAFVARHFELGGEREPAAAYYLQAAKRAAQAFANDEALAYGRRALGLRPSAASDRYEMLALIEEILDRIGDRGEQTKCLAELNRIARRLGDIERMREVLRRRESLSRHLRDYARARRDLALLQGLASGDARWEAIASRDEAALLHDYGSEVEAHNQATRATARAAQANDAAILVSALTLQADIAAALGRRAEAGECLQFAKAAAEPTGSLMLSMRVLYCELTVLTHFQDWASLAESGPRLLELTASMGSSHFAAAAHTMLGGALGCLSRIADARQHLRAAIELYRRCDSSGLLVAYNNLASIELEIGRDDYARDALDGIDAVVADSDSVYGRACAALIRCELAAQRANYGEAIELADRVIAAATVRENELFEGEALRCKGTSLRASGRAVEAIPVLARAVALFERLNIAPSAKRASAELSLAYALAGNTRAAASLAERLASGEVPPTAESLQVIWPVSQALAAIGRRTQARTILGRAHDAFKSRCRRLRDRRDRIAFTQLPENVELARACLAAGVGSEVRGAKAENPPVHRVPKTRTAGRLRPHGPFL